MAKAKKGLDKKVKEAVKFNIKNNGQLLWIIGGMIGLMILFFAFYFFFHSLSKFNFEGLTFTTEKYSQLTVYSYYYNFVYNNTLYKYSLYLREDPRKNKITIEKNSPISFGEIDKFVFVTANWTELRGCGDWTISVGSLNYFIAGNVFKPVLSTTILSEATNQMPYATCQSQPDRTVILIKMGNETKIESGNGGQSCDVITVAKCSDMLGAVERFIIESLVDAKKATAEEQSTKTATSSPSYYQYQVVVDNKTVAGH